MIGKRLVLILSLAVAALLLAACGGPTPDRVATRVAEDLAVAATLTASVPTSAPAAATNTQVLVATDTQVPTATDTQVPAATDTPAPVATDTSAPTPTTTPTKIEIVVPPPGTTPPSPPSPTPILIAVLPVDGGGDDVLNIRNSNAVMSGRNVTLPGFSPAEVGQPMVFTDRIVFQVEIHDSNVGTYDGAGIDHVRFTITDDRGRQVHYRQENTPGYCVFGGGEPGCTVLNLAEAGYKWPDGATIYPGTYNVAIDIQPHTGDTVTWFWTFAIQFPNNMARIDDIYLQGNQYSVDFETFGYTPQLPGQHVHFFFNTVPPEQAGVPGQGPWKLYGGPSPFTEYGPGDRPQGATQMCILVANADHSVQPNSGNCVDLP
jgi:hypothetical protein